MKKNIITKQIVSILLIAFLIITTKVYAANDSFETTLKASNTQVKAEENITVTIGLKNIAVEGGDKGIGAYAGNIKVDNSVLEYVSSSGIGKWETPVYENGSITGNTNDASVVNTAQDIATITFKVKKDAKLGETTISLENFYGSNAKDDIFTGTKSINITVIGNGNDTNNNGGGSSNGGSSNQPSNNNPGITQNVSGNKNNKVNTTSTSKENVKKGTLPKAGNGSIIIFTVIGGCILLAITFYVKLKLIDRKIK